MFRVRHSVTGQYPNGLRGRRLRAGDDRSGSGRFVLERSGTTEQPPGHWLDITDTLATQENLSTLQTAYLGSLVSQAENDAGIAAWTVKYQDLLWRPITAIHDCANWNPYFTTCDSSWSSLIATPPHPDYLAGHPAFSGAAATVLKNFFGTDADPGFIDLGHVLQFRIVVTSA